MSNVEPLSLVVSEGGPKVELKGTEVKAAEVQTAEALLKRADEIGNELRVLIIAAKRLPRDKGFEPHQDPTRSLSLAQMYLQTGFMWLRRAIECPKVF